MREPQGFFLRSGSVANRTYWVWDHPVRLQTEPTGSGTTRFGCKPNLLGLGPPGSVANRTYWVWDHPVRLQTEPTGSGTTRFGCKPNLLGLGPPGSVANRTYWVWDHKVIFSKIDTYGAVSNRTYRGVQIIMGSTIKYGANSAGSWSTSLISVGSDSCQIP